MPEADGVVLGRVDERLKAVECDVRDIKTAISGNRPHWTTILAATVASGSLIVTLAINL